jgi:diacylglycerol kinase (ATP)
VTTPRRIALFNPMAGQRWHARRVRHALDLLARDPSLTIVETHAGGVTAQARALLQQGATELVACGGDGTVCDVASALVGTDVPLRIMPCGTTNVFARDVGLPVDPVRALDATALDRATAHRVIKTWTAGDHQLVLGAGIGWDARLLTRLSRRYKRALGLGAMVPLGAWLAVRYDFPALLVRGIDVEGHAQELAGTSMLICNISHWGGRNVAFPGVDPSDDVLDVVVCTPRNFLHLATFWSLLMIPGGRPLRLTGVHHLRLRSLTVSVVGRASADVHVNGDVVHRLGATYPPLRIEPSGTFLVRVPQ